MRNLVGLDDKSFIIEKYKQVINELIKFRDERIYATAGTVLEYKYRILKNKESNMNFKLSANYYYLISEIEALTTDDFASFLKASIDKKVFNKVFIELSYKYGNNNPTYSYVNVLELSTKIKF